MHMLTILTQALLLGITSAAVPAPSCNANNCYRAVKALAFPTRSTSADCSAFQTTYSAIATVTVTGPTAFTPAVTPSVRTIPAYASSCVDEANYRSACSCIGVTSTVIQTTLTVTAATSACTTYALQVVGGTYASKYLTTNVPNGFGALGAAADTLAGATLVEYRDHRFYEPGSNSIVINTESAFVPMFCDISSITGFITCSTQPGVPRPFVTDLHLGNFVYLKADNNVGSYSNLFDIKAVPACG